MPQDQATPPRTAVVLEPGYASYETEASVLADLNVRMAAIGSDEDAILGLTALNPAALLVRERTIGAAEMEACPNLKVIVRYGVGVDNVDIDHANRRGIKIANVPDYGAEIEVSEHAIALYLAVQRRIIARDAEVRRGVWGVGQKARIPGRDGGTVGIIGCGRIGLAAARKFRALGLSRVLAFDPLLTPDRARSMEIEHATLEDLCQSADVISLHAPLTEATHHIIGAPELALMKPNSILVNVSRGGLIDEIALAAALNSGRIFGAGIDVFETEPVAQDNPLLSTPNTILSDHAAWYSERSVEVLQRLAAEEVRRVLIGQSPKNYVNAAHP